jgi:hypothetical protein
LSTSIERRKSSSRNRGRHFPEPTDETERLPALVVAVRRVRVRLRLPEAEAAEGALAAAAVEGLAARERGSQAAGPLMLARRATTSRLQSCSEIERICGEGESGNFCLGNRF